jgi:peroxiredoxin
MANQGTTVTVGSAAPAFTLPTPGGEPRALADYLARGPVLLAFHRGIW